MDKDNTLKLSRKNDELQRTLRKLTRDELTGWNNMKDDFLLEHRLILSQRDYEKSPPPKSVSRNISPLPPTKNKVKMRSNLIPISFSSNSKEFEQQRVPKISRYWQKRFTISKVRAFGKSVNIKKETHYLAQFKLANPANNKVRNRSNSPIFSFLPQIDVCKAIFSKKC